MKHLNLVFILLSSLTYGQARIDSIAAELKVLGLTMLEDSLEANRLKASQEFEEKVEEALAIEASFDYTFAEVKNLSALRAPDDKFKIYSWVFPKTDGTYDFFGYLYIKPKKAEPYFIKLEEGSLNASQVGDQVLEVDQWYGALYYKVLHHKRRRKHYYTLLGWHGKDRLETQKLVETLVFDAYDQPFFGHPMIQVNEKEKLRTRYILRYSADAFVALRYEPRYRMIIMDNLSPVQDNAEGMYQFYGPDFTYNGFKMKKGKWIFERDIDVRNLGND